MRISLITQNLYVQLGVFLVIVTADLVLNEEETTEIGTCKIMGSKEPWAKIEKNKLKISSRLRPTS
jgi:hypothetical protein